MLALDPSHVFSIFTVGVLYSNVYCPQKKAIQFKSSSPHHKSFFVLTLNNF